MTAAPQTCRCIICHDHGDRVTIGHVGEHGWSVMQIPEDHDGPGRAFTIGLWHTHGRPELAIFGLDIDTMKDCLNVLGRQTADGWPPDVEREEERGHVIDGDPVMFKVIDPRWYKAFFGTAIAFYRRPPLPFAQVLWADRDGHFPGDSACDPAVGDRRPSLWLPPERHPPGVWTQDL